jgi:Na+:H+ antiporter
MNTIEIVICLILLFMAVPDLCKRLGRPALAYSVFILFGFVAAPLVNGDVATMLKQAGYVGFLLLLFEVGLEIDLPRFHELLRPLRFVSVWMLLQYPVVIGISRLLGMTWIEALIAAAALTSCSVGMAHAAWKHYPGLSGEARPFVLRIMVLLEMLAIVLLSMETVTLKNGLSWLILAKLLGIAVTIFLISRFSDHLARLFQTILEKTTHWRMHFLVLLILIICAVGERLGLSAAKTAFFLGLFLSPAKHDGMSLEQHMAPLSERFLIPIFFVALGLQIDWHAFVAWQAWLFVTSGLLLLALRAILHRHFLKTGGDWRAFLLLCPNLTIVALAANVLLENGSESGVVSRLLVTGLFMSIAAVLLLPASSTKATATNN